MFGWLKKLFAHKPKKYVLLLFHGNFGVTEIKHCRVVCETEKAFQIQLPSGYSLLFHCDIPGDIVWHLKNDPRIQEVFEE